jgi:hypothetical protein
MRFVVLHVGIVTHRIGQAGARTRGGPEHSRRVEQAHSKQDEQLSIGIVRHLMCYVHASDDCRGWQAPHRES